MGGSRAGASGTLRSKTPGGAHRAVCSWPTPRRRFTPGTQVLKYRRAVLEPSIARCRTLALEIVANI